MAGIQVNLQDGEGSEYTVVKHDYNGDTYHLVEGFASPEVLFSALKRYQPHKDDLWLHTYGKAGTHWVYEIIGILLSGELQPYPQTKLEEFIELFPDTLARPGPRILNTHIADKYLPDVIFQKTKCIVVVRNPKSVAASAYHFTLGRPDLNYSGSFNGFLTRYKDTGNYGEMSGTWYQYYTSLWDKYKHNPNVHFMFFEELKKDLVSGIMDLSKFLGLDRDKDFCEGVAGLTSFEYMKKGYSEKKIRRNLPILRKGTIDNWKKEFTVMQNEEFDKNFEKQMENYPDLTRRIHFQ